ncbi:MAG: hypothetical protein P8168_14060 [Deltaproteobacteria bacterium]
MRKISLIMALSLVLVFGLTLQASAFDVIDISGDSNYVITDKNLNSHNIKEDYNATALIPYPSHDGYAVIDLPGPIWFNKEIVFDADDAGDNNFQITWDITNTSPYTWSDYHIVFMNDIGQVISEPNTSSAEFKGVTIIGNSEVDFYYDPPGGGLIYTDDTLNITLGLDLTGLPEAGGTIRCRQIATTAVPLPASLPLLGSGLLGLGLLGWRKVRS